MPSSDDPAGNEQPELALGRQRLRQVLAYGRKVFSIGARLEQVRDRRMDPRVPTALVMRIVLLLGLLRIRSLNALEPRLAEPWMQRALGLVPGDEPPCSVDTVSYTLQRTEVSTVRDVLVGIIKKAERNKVFREGWLGALRYAALDGWEPFASYERCCPACLTRKVQVGKERVTQYYHRYVVALLLDERLDVVLDAEPILSADVRRERGMPDVTGHEGELTAAKRLVRRLHDTYGRWLDVLVGDALYGNGPFLTLATECGYGVIAVLKKTSDEPLKEALAIWKDGPADEVVDDKAKDERIELWDCRELRTLETYRGPIRVVRGLVHKAAGDTTHTWCFAVTGKACRLDPRAVLRVGRARWHIENTGFHQWATYWRFSHVFTHGRDALPALLYIFFVAFNLLQLFVYRQIGGPGGYGRDRGSNTTRTLWRLVDEMLGDLERLVQPVAWDTS